MNEESASGRLHTDFYVSETFLISLWWHSPRLDLHLQICLFCILCACTYTIVRIFLTGNRWRDLRSLVKCAGDFSKNTRRGDPATAGCKARPIPVSKNISLELGRDWFLLSRRARGEFSLPPTYSISSCTREQSSVAFIAQLSLWKQCGELSKKGAKWSLRKDILNKKQRKKLTKKLI